MSGLRLKAQWEEAEDVATPELAATWARFSIFVGDDCLSLIEDSRAGGYRDTLDISVYPLAEWIAFNWWFLTTPNARHGQPSLDRQRFSLAAAGDGFPLPDLLLMPESDVVLARQLRQHHPSSRVRFVRSGLYLLDLAETTYALQRFVDSVVRRLDDQEIQHTRLQDEWTSVQGTAGEEREFCVAAATLGLDPYALSEADADLIVRTADRLADPALFVGLAAGVSPDQLDEGAEWLNTSLDALRQLDGATTFSSLAPLAFEIPELKGAESGIDPGAPWGAGYAQATLLRDVLELEPVQPFAPSSYVGHAAVDDIPPGLLQGVCELRAVTNPTVVSATRRASSLNFLEARVLIRSLFTAKAGPQVITHGNSLSDRVERAAAAELLAPAEGIAELLGGDLAAETRSRVAAHFGVDEIVVDHQIENQLGAGW